MLAEEAVVPRASFFYTLRPAAAVLGRQEKDPPTRGLPFQRAILVVGRATRLSRQDRGSIGHSEESMTQVLAALISGVVALAVSLLGFKLQESRLRSELRTEFMAEEAILRLLENKDFQLRSFSVIKHH